MKLPVAGEWWQYTVTAPHPYKVEFYIEEVVEKAPYGDSWVIYSNNDNSGDYFVATMEEFMGTAYYCYGTWSLYTDN